MTKPRKIDIKKEHTLDDLTCVAKTVLPLAKQLLGSRGLMEIELLSNWKEIVGEDLAAYTLPQKITFRKDERANGCLEMMVLSGAFAMEVKQRESQILEKINTFFGYSALNRLKIIQNSCPENFLLEKNPIDNMKKNLVTEEEEIYITDIIKDVYNDDLRLRLENLGRAVLSNKKK